jgi:hypothetical protein
MATVEEPDLAKRRASLEEKMRLEKEWKVVMAAATATAAMEQGNTASKKVQDKTAKQFKAATAKPRAAFDITATDAGDTALREASREDAARTVGQEAAAAEGRPLTFAGDSAFDMQGSKVRKTKKVRKQAAIDAVAELGVEDELLALANPRVVMRGAAREKEEEEGHARAGNALLGKQLEEEKASVRHRENGGKDTGTSAGGSTGMKAVSATAEGRKGGGKHRKRKGSAPNGGNASSTAWLIRNAAQGRGLATLYVLCGSLSLLLFGLLFRICRVVIIFP